MMKKTNYIHILLFLTSVNLIESNESEEENPRKFYSISEINNGPGLFYNSLGNAKLNNDWLTLLSFTNISVSEETLSVLDNMLIKSNNLCNIPRKFNKTKSSSKVTVSNCKRTFEMTKIKIDKLHDKFESICHLTGHNFGQNYRNKRGLINGVSYAFKWLFGTPDADDAQYYTEAIQTIHEENVNSQKLIKQQIHVLTDAISSYNESCMSLFANEKKLNDNIQKFNRFSERVTNKINALSFIESINSHFSTMNLIMENLEATFDDIISSILFSKQNVLHPFIITPKQLKTELLKIKIKGQSEFPIDINNYNDIYKYFSISVLSVLYSEKVLIFAIKIPLVDKEQYQLYKLIPLPIQMANSPVYSYIDPSSPYLLLSTGRTYYSQPKDLTSCQLLPGSTTFICSKLTKYYIEARPICETDLKLKQLAKIPTSCNTKTIKSEMEVWHQIGSNQWLYIITEPIIATINCGEVNSPIRDFKLQGTGVFTLQPSCKCYTLSTVLIAYTNQTANFSNYVPSININGDDCCIERQEYLDQESMEPVKLHNLNLDELRHAQHKLQQFDQLLEKNINKPFLVQHSTFFNYIVGAVIITILIMVCCCNKCRLLGAIYRALSKCFSKSSSHGNHQICINSHNSISNNSISSIEERESYKLRPRPRLNKNFLSLESVSDLIAVQEEKEKSEKINRKSSLRC